MNKTVYILFFLLLVFSCKKQTEPEITLIKSTHLKIDELDVIMKFPTAIIIKDSILYVMDRKPFDYFIHTFKYPSMKYIRSFGKKGDGPNEYISIGGFIIDENYIYLFETNKGRLDIYNINDLSLVKSVSYPQEIRPISQTTQFEDGFLTIDNTGTNRLAILDKSGNIVKKIHTIKNVNNEVSNLSPQLKATLHTALIDYSSKYQIAAVASLLGDVLELYYFKNQNQNQIEQKLIVGDGGYPNIDKIDGMIYMGKMEGFFDVKICDDEIYTIYSGITRKEMIEMDRKNISVPNGGNKIVVYDLKGNIVKRYGLDRNIYGFWVDKKNKKIFAVDNNGNDQIYYFDMP